VQVQTPSIKHHVDSHIIISKKEYKSWPLKFVLEL